MTFKYYKLVFFVITTFLISSIESQSMIDLNLQVQMGPIQSVTTDDEVDSPDLDYQYAIEQYSLANDLFLKSHFIEAESILLKVLETFIVCNDPLYLGRTYNLLGLIYYYQKSNVTALRYFLKAKECYGNSNQPVSSATISINIGNIYFEHNKFDKAFESYVEAKELAKQLKYRRGYRICLQNIGEVYANPSNHNFDEVKALLYFERSKNLMVADSDYAGHADILQTEAKLLSRKNEREKAILILKNADSLLSKGGFEVQKASNALKLSNLYLELNNRNVAKSYLDYATLIYNKFQDVSLYQELLSVKEKYSLRVNDYKSAYFCNNKRSLIKDSLSHISQLEIIDNLFDSYENEDLLAKEKTKLNNIKKFQEEQLEEKNYLVIIFLCLLIVAVGFLTFLWFYLKKLNKLNAKIEKQKKELRFKAKQLSLANNKIANYNLHLQKEIEKNVQKLELKSEELEVFLYQTSHAFRRPLTTVQGLINVCRLDHSPEFISEHLEYMHETTVQMDRMLSKLQMIEDLQLTKKEKEPINFEQILTSTLNRYKDSIDKHVIGFSYTLKNIPDFSCFPKVYTAIIRHLVSNSIVYRCRVKPFVNVEIDYNEKGNKLHIQVSDNGEGIDFSLHKEIFNMYSRKNERSKGSGLGLYILKLAIDKLQGKVKLLSEKGRGSLFIISIPLDVNISTLTKQRMNKCYEYVHSTLVN